MNALQWWPAIDQNFKGLSEDYFRKYLLFVKVESISRTQKTCFFLFIKKKKKSFEDKLFI